MSLVGTRPPTVDEYEQYEIGHRKRLELYLPESIIKSNGEYYPISVLMFKGCMEKNIRDRYDYWYT